QPRGVPLPHRVICPSHPHRPGRGQCETGNDYGGQEWAHVATDQCIAEQSIHSLSTSAETARLSRWTETKKRGLSALDALRRPAMAPAADRGVRPTVGS